jgi:hypothetical protein
MLTLPCCAFLRVCPLLPLIRRSRSNFCRKLRAEARVSFRLHGRPHPPPPPAFARE